MLHKHVFFLEKIIYFIYRKLVKNPDKKNFLTGFLTNVMIHP